LNLYNQVADYWRFQIKNKLFQPGAQLPTEQDLMKLHNVSRITIKQAMRILVDEGLVTVRQGKGTFVSEGKKQWELSKLSSFTEDIKSRGHKPGTKVLKKEICNGAFEQLNLTDASSSTIAIERLRLENDDPIGIELIRLPYDLFYNIYDDIKDNESIYDLVEKKTGLKLAYGTEFLEASLADHNMSQILQIPSKSPVMKFERISYLSNDRPVEYTSSIYRSDKYRFKVTLQR
jgi:GntR family transcriptional regulator, N-acetylglucosamine utilization regulator